MTWIIYSSLILFPLWVNAQIGTETSAYDAITLQLLSKKVLKDKKLGGDCKCSSHLHANYLLAFNDTIYQQTLDDSFVCFFMNLQHNPFPQESLWDIPFMISAEDIKITTIGNRPSPTISSKKNSPKRKHKPYYNTTRINPLQIDDKFCPIPYKLDQA